MKEDFGLILWNILLKEKQDIVNTLFIIQKAQTSPNYLQCSYSLVND